MAKRKPVAQEFNTIDMKDGMPVSAEEAVQPETVLEKIEAKTGDTMTIKDEIKEKLEAYEKLEKTVSALNKENAALKDKVAEYVEEVTELREKVKNTVVKEVIKEVVKEVPVEGSSAALEKEVKALREENDEYLIKISELTFENAKLKCEAEEAAKAKPVKSEHPKVQPYPNVYRNSAALNGYSAWN